MATGSMSKGPGKSYREGLSLDRLFRMFPTDEAAEAWFTAERWPDGPYCPHCGSRNIQCGIAHPRHRAEIVVRLHQVAEAGLVLHRHDVDRHLRKNHHGFLAPTVASRHSYQGVDRKFSIAVKSSVRRGEGSKHKSALV